MSLYRTSGAYYDIEKYDKQTTVECTVISYLISSILKYHYKKITYDVCKFKSDDQFSGYNKKNLDGTLK